MNNRYLSIALVLLAIEIFIAVYVKDRFIRPFFGDFLAVIFVYTLIRTFFSHSFKVALWSLGIAYFIETLQYFKFIEISGLIKYKILAVVIGNSFSWLDILAYTLGFIFIVVIAYFEIFKALWKLQFESSKS
jgi:hypothetical protein